MLLKVNNDEEVKSVNPSHLLSINLSKQLRHSLTSSETVDDGSSYED